MTLQWQQQAAMAIASWLALAWLIVWVEPDYVADVLWQKSYLPFFGLVWLGCFWLFAALSRRWKQSLLWASSITFWLWLRSIHLDNLWTSGLLITFNLVWTYYWKLNKQ